MEPLADRDGSRYLLPLGINALANAPIPRCAIALAGGAKFIRVNQWANAYVANEGFMEGRAADAMRYRSMLRAEQIRVFADSHVKHGSQAIVADRSIEELRRDLAFFDVDVVIATGQRTGNTATIEEIETIGGATHLPLLVGFGVTKENVVEILRRTSGVMVASSLKHGGVWWNAVDIERVKAFAAAAGGAWLLTLSDLLLAENADVFEAMTGHPFVTAIREGRLTRRQVDAYLVYEGAFVDTAISFFAISSHAPTTWRTSGASSSSSMRSPTNRSPISRRCSPHAALIHRLTRYDRACAPNDDSVAVSAKLSYSESRFRWRTAAMIADAPMLGSVASRGSCHRLDAKRGSMPQRGCAQGLFWSNVLPVETEMG